MTKIPYKKVMVIGSGPIIIGQAAEFDYSGSQCLQVLREKGIESVLVNSNPATIMTDKSMADKVYMEPINEEFVKKILVKERPDAVLSSFGGQTALNITKQLAESGFLDKLNIKVLGSHLETIKTAEDRLLFREKMISMDIPVVEGEIVSNMKDGIKAAEKYGFPLIIRPAYTLGGAGGGLVYNMQEYEETLSKGLLLSSIGQCLIEKSIAGYKEIEYEVIRDHNDNAIIVCNMENVDPVGVHTGDSIVIAPSQTLSDDDYQNLRDVSLRVVRALDIHGACNVQLALDPHSSNYFIIEVNPRVSRSSALASKATGYPIAKIATHIALGMSLDEIQNPITGKTFASYEPSIDYVVTKFPRWPFDKFKTANRKLGSQMKSTGEVMALGRNFEESMLKAVRSLELGYFHLYDPCFDHSSLSELEEFIAKGTDLRMFAIATYLRKGGNAEKITELVMMDPFFLNKVKNILNAEKQLQNSGLESEAVFKAKRLGFTDRAIAFFAKSEIEAVRSVREQNDIKPVIKLVDSCAAEFPAETPYFYQTYEQVDEWEAESEKSIAIIGSGPIRIGQGIEFDYSCVHSLIACRAKGYKTVMINNNPETCSTDFTLSDRLYFEPLYDEDVLAVLEREKPEGVIVQFGGQTAINLTQAIQAAGFQVIGTSPENIARAEDREQFETAMNELGILRPKGLTLKSRDDIDKILPQIEYPTMVRPSFVLGGLAMEIIYSEEELVRYLSSDVTISPEMPLLIDQYIKGIEIEVDGICDGKAVLIPGIMEHIERAGVHSGDSIAVYPPVNLYEDVKNKVIEITKKLATKLDIKGIFNIQFMYKKGNVYVIEVNPRASRTVPFLSKMTGIPMAQVATRIMLGETLKDMDYSDGLYPTPDFYSVKVPVFSFDKLHDVEPALGPEMKSTGEVLGRDKNLPLALYKGLLALGLQVPDSGNVLITLSDRYKEESFDMIRRFKELGFNILSTEGTGKFIKEKLGISVEVVPKIGHADYNLIHYLKDNKIDVIINTLSKGKKSNTDGFYLRRTAFEKKIPCFTSIDTAMALLDVIEYRHIGVMEG
ncbi:MAG: carbamoyl-phosphate synthase large subunit [Halobacteriovoraceae bacterium]|nr:carbamoyl-phosphate synthase large subunit [Halobacteriovoraceae bacterium]